MSAWKLSFAHVSEVVRSDLPTADAVHAAVESGAIASAYYAQGWHFAVEPA